MSALPQHVPLLVRPIGLEAVTLGELAACVRALDPGSRALLDLSLRRRLSFESMAPVLRTDPFDLARRRARAVARIAAELDLEGRGVIATVKAALARLPDEAWGVAVAPPAPVQAEAMAKAARALMERLREQREAAEVEAAAPEPEPAATGPEPEPADTVEFERIERPVAATTMAAAFAGHPAFAVELDDTSTPLPPLAIALAKAAASERQAAAQIETPAAPPAEESAPASAIPESVALTVPPAGEREPHRRIARGGLLIGLLLAIARFFLGRR